MGKRGGREGDGREKMERGKQELRKGKRKGKEKRKGGKKKDGQELRLPHTHFKSRCLCIRLQNSNENLYSPFYTVFRIFR